MMPCFRASQPYKTMSRTEMVDWAAEVVVARKEEVIDMLRVEEETGEKKEGGRRLTLSSLSLEA